MIEPCAAVGGVLEGNFEGAASRPGDSGLRKEGSRVDLPAASNRGHCSMTWSCSPVVVGRLGRVAELGSVGGEVSLWGSIVP